MQQDNILIYKRVQEIDYDLKVKGVLIYQRHVQAIFEYQRKFNVQFDFNSETAKIIDGWYKTVYGKNLNIPLNSDYLIKINGDIFVLGAPSFYGKIEIYWNEGQIVAPPKTYNNIKIDARNFITNITPTYSSMLSHCDVEKTMKWMKKVDEIDIYFQDNKRGTNGSMYKIIHGDLISAKEHFMIQSYDMTEWQCLQVAEKLLKMYITKYKNQEPKKIHILYKLNETAGITDPVILSLIPLLEADPSSRYEVKTTREEAFNKYEAIINFIDSFIKIF